VGGECWHTPYIDAEGKCYQCGERFCENFHQQRTFDNWEDFGWLHENMMGKPYDIAFGEYIHGTKGYTIDKWWALTVAERCQLICDFLREQEEQ